MSGINQFLLQYGVAAIFLVMLVKSAGVPIPIPGDLIIFTAAVGAAQGKLVGWQAFLAVFLALVAGSLVQFLLARGPGRGILYRLGRYVGLTTPRIDAASEKIRKGGIPGLTLAMLVPGVRGAAILASGLIDLPVARFLIGLSLGSLLFLSLHFFLGFAGGSALLVIGRILPLPLALVVIVALLVIVYLLWMVAARRQKAARVALISSAGTTSVEIGQANAAALELWHEGICPACLALYTANQLRSFTTDRVGY